jgi:hypothetical protein
MNHHFNCQNFLEKLRNSGYISLSPLQQSPDFGSIYALFDDLTEFIASYDAKSVVESIDNCLDGFIAVSNNPVIKESIKRSTTLSCKNMEIHSGRRKQLFNSCSF